MITTSTIRLVVDPVCESLDDVVDGGIKLVVDELSTVIITVTEGDLSLIFHIINSDNTIHLKHILNAML